jgi:hypothetical protein
MLSLQTMNTLSRYLPTYRSFVSKISSIHPGTIMQTLNGKLISEEVSDFDKVNQQMENLAQQFEQLDLKLTTISENDKSEYLKRIVSLQVSLQKLERIYSRLLSTTVLAAIGLASWSFVLGLNHDPSPAKQVKFTLDSALNQPFKNR